MASELWVQSLRANYRPAHKSRPSNANRASRSSYDTKDNSRPVQTKSPPNKKVGPNTLGVESPTNKRSEPVVDVPEKCLNICCNYLADTFEPRSKLMSKIRTECAVDRTRVLNQISRAEARHASYQREIRRLKRILAACPPPGQVSSTRTCRKSLTLCKHACCDASLCPPRGSTEMIRLRRIVQQLQIRGRELLEYLTLKRSQVSLIRRLPPELLQMIFLFAIPQKRDLSPSLATNTDAVRLAHVCSYWRSIALDTSKLWTTIQTLRHPSRHQANIDHLKFYSLYAKASPLTVRCCNRISRPFLVELARLSHRWSNIVLAVGNSTLDELDVVRRKIPLLRSLTICNECERDGTQANGTFECAPVLRRIVLTASFNGNVWPFSFILPWEQLTSLTLVPISMSVFSECIRNCPQLLYFYAKIHPRAVQQPMTELRHSSLRKLGLESFGLLNGEVLMPYSFPHLQSLSVVMADLLHPLSRTLDPDVLAFIARSPHLEMLSLRMWGSVTTADLVALLLAAPSLRMLHFRDRKTVFVTPKFDAPLVMRALDDSFDIVEPQSLVELDVEKCRAYDEVELLALLKMHGKGCPFFDPFGIEQARLRIEGAPFDDEAELNYLSNR
ncbi:F-box domain-containing protein [Mycena sanguinolenta]|uniref:F-box domain-containing protein n=1 Tax=Mycena sanguinolenta TaxID=230812 RepID=A0A8H7D8S2_9AGAR|nr:F-box domain-containing protein [Mycena sanguinolenta]